MEDVEFFLPWREPTFKEKIVISSRSTIVKEIKLPEFEINQQEFLIDEKYRFIDLEKLQKMNNKKYDVKELRDISAKLGLPLNKKKLDLVKQIKQKIGVE